MAAHGVAGRAFASRRRARDDAARAHSVAVGARSHPVHAQGNPVCAQSDPVCVQGDAVRGRSDPVRARAGFMGGFASAWVAEGGLRVGCTDMMRCSGVFIPARGLRGRQIIVA